MAFKVLKWPVGCAPQDLSKLPFPNSCFFFLHSCFFILLCLMTRLQCSGGKCSGQKPQRSWNYLKRKYRCVLKQDFCDFLFFSVAHVFSLVICIVSKPLWSYLVTRKPISKWKIALHHCRDNLLKNLKGRIEKVDLLCRSEYLLQQHCCYIFTVIMDISYR